VAGSNTAPVVDRIRIIPRATDFLDRNVGSSGEVFFSRDSNSLRVYSGRSEDVSGFELARADLVNVDTSSFLKTANLNTISISAFSDVMYPTTPTPGQILVWSAEHEHFINQDADLEGGASVDVADTAPTTPTSGNLWLNTETGKLYIYIDDGTSSQWIEPATTGGGGGSSSATTLNGQAGSYYLDYTNFTNTPSIPTTIGSLTDVSASTPSDGQILKWSGANSQWELSSDLTGGAGGGIGLTDFSVTSNPVGTANLTYDNTTGVFTYTPPDLSSYLTSYTETSTLANVTSRGASTNDAVTINNTLTVEDIETTGAGTPALTSTSSYSITAPDGVTVNGVPLPTYGGKLVLGATPTWTGSSGITVAQSSAGVYTVTFTTAYGAATDYIISATHQEWSSAPDVLFNIEKAAGSFTITIQRASNGNSVDDGEMALLIYEF